MLRFQFIDNSSAYTDRGQSAMLAGNRITFADSSFRWDDLKRFHIVLLGVQDNNDAELNAIRQHFCKLYLQSDRVNVIDLGNIHHSSPEFTAVLDRLSQAGVLTILLGVSAQKTVELFASAASISKDISITSITPDVKAEQLAAFTENSGSRQARFTALGFQTYHTDSMVLKLLAKHSCEAIRLGIVRANAANAEPIIRDSHLLAIDTTAVRASDGGHSPNGFYAEELCRLAWYAGMSDSLNLLIFQNSVYGSLSSELIAQTLWHVVEGYADRKPELPTGENIKRFIVDRGKLGEELQFFQSAITNRWWMLIPVEGEEPSVIISCSYDDYQKACDAEIPDRWLFFYQKLNAHG